MLVVIIDCRPPEPGIVSDEWRILDRPRMVVVIHLTRFNLVDSVEALIVITVVITLALGHKNVTAIVNLGLVEKPEICKPVLPIA